MTTPDTPPDGPAPDGFAAPDDAPHDAPAPDQAPTGWGQPQYGRYAPGYGQPPTPTPPGSGQGPAYGAPQYGTPQYGAPQYGTPQYGGQPPFGPPLALAARPGIVPLRPLTLGEIFDGAFGAIRHNPRVMLGLSCVVVVVVSLIGGLLGYAFSGYLAELFASAPDDFAFNGMENDIAVLYSGAVGTGVATGLATPVISGLLTVSIGQSVIGNKLSVGEVWRRVGRRAGFLIAFSLLYGLFAVLAAAVLVLLTVVAAAAAPALGVLVGLVGAAALVCLLVWVGTRTGLVPPALALEGQPFWRTVTRCWRLTRGSFWRIFGIYLLAYLATGLITQVLSYPVGIAAGLALGTGSAIIGTAVLTLGTALVTMIQTVFLGSVVALLYIDVRMRREGLDVELAAAASEQSVP